MKRSIAKSVPVVTHLRRNVQLKKNMNRKRQFEPGTRNINRKTPWTWTLPKVTPRQIQMIPRGEVVVECVTHLHTLDSISVKSQVCACGSISGASFSQNREKLCMTTGCVCICCLLLVCLGDVQERVGVVVRVQQVRNTASTTPFRTDTS